MSECMNMKEMLEKLMYANDGTCNILQDAIELMQKDYIETGSENLYNSLQLLEIAMKHMRGW